MNVIEEYVDKSFLGFNADMFYEGDYQGKLYIAIPRNGKYTLLSNDSLSTKSIEYRVGYRTEFNITELDRLYRSKLFAVYKGNEYRIQRVSARLAEIELLAREGKRLEDIQLGFIEDVYENAIYKNVQLEEIEKIRIERENVYEQFLGKYSQ